MDGWIKLHRKLIEWEWYDDINVKVLFLHLLLTANHEDKKWRGKTILRGQRLTSIEHLAEETKLTPQKVRTALNKLKTTNEITYTSTNKNTLVTIEKYEDYQNTKNEDNKQDNTQSNNETTNSQQTNNNQITTNKNEKNIKNDKNERINIKENKKRKTFEDVFTENSFSEELKNTLKDFIDMRKTIKKPMTSKAIELLIRNLNKLTNSEQEKIAILNQSIEHGWQTVYPLKSIKNNTTSGTITDFKDLWEEARKEDEQSRNNTSYNSFSW